MSSETRHLSPLGNASPWLMHELTGTAGGTVLHWAAASGDRDMLAFLLERARDPSPRSYAGQTPLHVAAGRGHDPCVRLLLSDNAQPDLGAQAAPRRSSVEALSGNTAASPPQLSLL